MAKILHKYFKEISEYHGRIKGDGSYNLEFFDVAKKKIEQEIKKILKTSVSSPALVNDYNIDVKSPIKNGEGVKIFIWDKRYCDSSFYTGIYIVYSFSNMGRGCTVAIKQGKKFPSIDKKRRMAKGYRRKAKSKSMKTFLNGKYLSKFGHDGTILGKQYSGNSYGNCENDLKRIFKVYVEWAESYKIRCDELMKDELGKKDSELNKTLNNFNFYNFVIDRGYFFSKNMIENYLLSLKVKPFTILTGNSGTGKTKLSQLFAEYLTQKFTSSSESNFHIINATTKLSSWGKAKDGVTDTRPGWTLSSDDFSAVLPLDKIEGTYEIEIDGYKTTGEIYFAPQIYYKRDCEDFRNHFEKLYFKEQDQIKIDEENDVKHEDQKVDMGISCNALKDAIKNEYTKSDVITFDKDISDTLLKGKRIGLTTAITDFIPLKSKVRCNIIAGGYFANGTFELKFKMANYMTDEIREYFNSLPNDIESVEIKIFGLNPSINNFVPTWNSIEYSRKNDDFCDENYSIVPIGANWTENRNVVGYYNVLTKKYHHTQSLDLLLKAKKEDNSDKPYFLILDEMNLSHVERYFSDFLSAMESGKSIHLHKAEEGIVEDVPQELIIPKNLFIIGTVNVDETTYMFSPKVLDRANVLEFKTFEELSIRDYIKKELSLMEFQGDVSYLENVLSDVDLRENILSVVNGDFSEVKYQVESVNVESEGMKNAGEKLSVAEGNVLEGIIAALTQINEYLKGSGFEFGYRTVNEILSFMVVAWKYEYQQQKWSNWSRYLDAQILQKILPKLHGSQMVLGETLDNLLTYCLGLDSVDDVPDVSEINDDCPYPESAKKLIQMKNVLEKQRYVSFIN